MERKDMSTSPKSQQIIRCLALVLSDQEIEERNRSQQVQQPVQLHLVQPPIRAPVRSVSSPPVQPAVLQVVQPHVALHEDHDDDQEMESDEIADKIILQELDLTIVYRPGNLNTVCDALSRYIGDESKEVREKSKKIADVTKPEVTVNSLQHEDLKRIQEDTPWISRIQKLLQEGKSISVDKYEEKDGIVYMKKKNNLSILLPNDKTITLPIIKQYHQSAHLGAHLGSEKTIANISRRFQWKNLTDDVKGFIKRCEACQRRKTNSHQETREPLGQLELLERPWERLHADICGPFPITANGNRYIFTIKDDFTKYVMAFPIEKQDATTICDCFSPTTDPISSQHYLRVVLQLLEVKHSLTAPYHKSANGTIERVHRTIEESLSSFVNSKQTDWDQKLPFIIFSINSSPHAVTKVSPHRALFGRELTTPEDIQLGPKPKDCIGSSYLDLEDFEECLKRHLQDLHIIIQERIKDQIGRNKERHMKTHRVKERKVDRYNVEYADGEKRKIANKDDVRLEGSGEEEISEEEDDEETQEVPEESEEDEDDGSSGTDRRSSKRIDGIKRKGRKRHENGSNNNGKRGGLQNRKTKSRNDETDSSNNLRRSERIKNKRFSRFKSLSMFKVMYCTVSSSCSSQLDLAHDSKTSQDHHCMDHPTDYDKMSNANVNDERKFQNDKLEYQDAECLNEYDVKIWSMARRTVRRSRSRRSTLRSDGMLPEGPPLYARSSGVQADKRFSLINSCKIKYTVFNECWDPTFLKTREHRLIKISFTGNEINWLKVGIRMWIREGIQELDPPQDYNSARSRSRSPRVDDHAQLPRENGEDRQDQLHREVGNEDQEEELIRELTPLQREVGYDWSFDTSPGYSPEPRADTPGYDEQPTAQHVPPQQPIYERTPRAQLPEPQVRYQRAPEPPAVHAPFNFDIRDEQALRYWNDAPESLKLQGVVDNLQVEAKKLLNLIDGVLPPMNLNKSQLLVVRISMNEDRPLVCIQGGPGTGKTYTHKLFSKKKTNYSRMESKIKFPGENGVIRIDQLNSYLFI
ncbi:Protein CBG20137 [Caenorhabditis briggsae]|uniref:RNA-directed DNA polymerase n=1 Tax=Caenorhabditis briggsae TaxID=6238 RepID=A8XX57_CAEBR|nr:Protein CBG20137 [Caenorhabditis briggsae]CAP37226.2 Protein CBG20137 [Caenorhabditis briggsae]